VTRNIAQAGGPEDAWVNRVFGSHYQPGTAYVAKSRHRQDDFRPFLFKTTDFGATWTAIHSNLPQRTINVVAEDNVNPNLLVVGNDSGVFVTADGGKRWIALRSNMPTAAVHDLVIHPREGDVVAGTYGRGIWVVPIAPLREMSEETLARPAHLFTVKPVTQRKEGIWGNYRLYGDDRVTTQNDPNGMVLNYYLRDAVEGSLSISIAGSAGEVRKLQGPGRAGVHRVVWDLDDSKGQPAGPGEYTVTLEVAGQKLSQKARLASRAPEDEPRERRFRPQ
jgi:hypothetical protein